MRAAPRENGVDVWVVDLSGKCGSESAWLDETEHDRATSFCRFEDRRRYIAGHAALRRILARYIGCRPENVRYGRNPAGKPFVLDQNGIEFNLAHSEDLALLAVGRCAVGIDVERVRLNFWTASLAKSLLRIEQPLPAPRELYAEWVRREASAKLSGLGIGATWVPPSAMSLIELPAAPDHVAALATHAPAHVAIYRDG